MRRVFVSLCGLALVAPVSAQEQAPAPKPVPTVNNVMTVPATPERTGLFSRMFNRNRTPGYVLPSTTPVPPGAATVMEPVYDRRGQVTAWRQVTMPQVPATAMQPAPMTGTTSVMEPTYNSRGRMVGWHAVTAAPMMATKPAEMAKPAETANPVTPAGNMVKATEPPHGQVVQATAVEPMPEQPRRGIMSRIFRR